MVDLGSLLDRSRDALAAVVDKAVHVEGFDLSSAASSDAGAGDSHDGLLRSILPRSFASDMELALPGHHRGHMADWRNVMLWIIALAVCVIIAAVTNPNETSFRSHLTELSFRRHLVDIRSDEHSTDTPSNDDVKTDLPSTTSTHTDTPIAPFRFANHVSISLRTPTLYYKTFYICAIALTSPLGPPAFLSDPISLVRNKGQVQKERLVLYVGYLGHWVQLGVVPRRLEWLWRVWFDQGKEKRKKSDRPGVMELRAVQPKDDQAKSTSAKLLRKSGSSVDLSNSPHPPPLPIPSFPESRRASIVSLLPQPDNAETSPAVIALKGDLSKAQDALQELRNQLLSHEQSVSDAHASLQATLDDLRNKRKEDDADRQELKSRTKALEEQKRQAESAKREAEKKLKGVEGLRDGLLAKIETTRREMLECQNGITASEKNVRTITEEGARFVVETQETVEQRRAELGLVEDEMADLEKEVEELIGKVKEAEERLRYSQEHGGQIENVAASTKEAQAAAAAAVASAIVGKGNNLAPEEEMMMMAAAYKVAAQEGYAHDHAGGWQNHHSAGHGNHSLGHSHSPLSHIPHPLGGHGHHNSNWASQAAAYMAEAGMPLLDQNYTARSTLGGFSRPANTNTGEKRLTDLTGFEDFGPGTTRDKRLSGDGFGQVLGLAANRLHTPPAEDDTSESEVYGLDPGSPNGGISTSFSANLLGQGLFRSLVGGDQTPVDEEGSTLEEALNFEPTLALSPALVMSGEEEQVDDDSSDSEEEWRSPVVDPHPTSQQSSPATAAKTKRFSFSRLLPPSSQSSVNTTPPSLPGLPALPGSRRWFSGTLSASAENLHSFPYHSTLSSDSLSLSLAPSHASGTAGTGGNAASSGTGSGPASIMYESSPFAPSEQERKKLASMGKWGPLSGLGKYRFAGTAARGAAASTGTPSGTGDVARSASLDLSPHSRVRSAPSPPGVSGTTTSVTGTSPGQSWMARHLHVHSGLSNGISFGSGGATNHHNINGETAGGGKLSSSPSASFGSTLATLGSSPSGSSFNPGSSIPGLSGLSGIEGAVGTRPLSSGESVLNAGAGAIPITIPTSTALSPSPSKGDEAEGEDREGKKSFKFFSLRKPSSSIFSGGSSPGADKDKDKDRLGDKASSSSAGGLGIGSGSGSGSGSGTATAPGASSGSPSRSPARSGALGRSWGSGS